MRNLAVKVPTDQPAGDPRRSMISGSIARPRAVIAAWGIEW